MKFSSLVQRIGGDGADAWLIHYAALAARERGEDAIILSVGDPDLATPEAVVARAVEALHAGDTHYTPVRGRLALRTAIAEQHYRRCDQLVNPEQVVVLSGAQNALMVALLCLSETGDEVLSLDPMYPTYPATLEASGARVVRVPLNPQNGFRFDPDALRRAITHRSRVLTFATPGNPTGLILSEEDLAGIADVAREHDLWVIADEVYAGLAPGGSVPSLARKLPERVVTIGSLSKTHAMCGWRLGWMVGPRELIDHTENLVLCMLYGLPGFIQEAAVTALGMAGEAEQRAREYCDRRAALMHEHMQGIPGVSALMPEAGMFMLLDVRGTGLQGRSFAEGLFQEQRVSVIPGDAFGTQTLGFVRVGFATEEALIVEACRRMRLYCEALAAKRVR